MAVSKTSASAVSSTASASADKPDAKKKLEEAFDGAIMGASGKATSNQTSFRAIASYYPIMFPALIPNPDDSDGEEPAPVSDQIPEISYSALSAEISGVLSDYSDEGYTITQVHNTAGTEYGTVHRAPDDDGNTTIGQGINVKQSNGRIGAVANPTTGDPFYTPTGYSGLFYFIIEWTT